MRGGLTDEAAIPNTDGKVWHETVCATGRIFGDLGADKGATESPQVS